MVCAIETVFYQRRRCCLRWKHTGLFHSHTMVNIPQNKLTSCDCSFQIQPTPNWTPSFEEGETVFVNLRSEKDTGRARILALPDSPPILDSCDPIQCSDRVKVEFENGDGTCHVRASRLQKIFTTDQLVVVCKYLVFRDFIGKWIDVRFSRQRNR